MRNIINLILLLVIVSCSNKLPYQDLSLDPEKRAKDLLERLTVEEKVSLMMDQSPGIERLQIKPYNWWNEALHGVARAGLATVFPQPIGMAASFDDEGVYQVFDAVSDEARAKNTDYNAKNSFERYQGLTMWTPTVNIYRDPRWGRGIETYGEDPYLTSKMGVQVVKGLQGNPQGGYDKLHACAKHFAVHSGPEWNRHSFDAKNIKSRDLFETYLPAFEALVKEGKVKEVMCAYNRYEGEPCCSSHQLLTQILRNEWGFDGIVVSDCWAIADFYKSGAHETHLDSVSASIEAVLSGTDLECGSSYQSLVKGIRNNQIKEEDIDKPLLKLLMARFALGEMDDIKQVPWSKIPYSVVGSVEHNDLALDAARKTMTLLVNKEKILPLDKEKIETIAVMGPNANDSVMQWGNYNGIPPHTVTLLQGIKNKVGDRLNIIYEPACSWIGDKLTKSVFHQCKTEEGHGFKGRFWNNLNQEGDPVTETHISTPFQFCTSGATVFAPGVNLTDFSASFTSTFIPEKGGEVVFDFYNNGKVVLAIDKEEVKTLFPKHGSRNGSYSMNVEAGKSYDIQIDYQFFRSDAQLDFNLGFKDNVNMERSLENIKEADVVIFASGISPSLEGEEMGVDLPGFKRGDRTDIELPKVQRDFIKALTSIGKKVILVNFSGSPIGLVPEEQSVYAILQAWYPGQAGGTAIADVLFGDYNPAGRLPVTFYKNVDQLPDFENYDMENRTYRYFKGEPLFSFGYGLSYSSFNYDDIKLENSKITLNKSLNFTVSVTNMSSYSGDEVVQVYIRKKGDENGPIKTLRDFKRIHIPAEETLQVEFSLTPKQLVWWNKESNSVNMHSGEYEIMVGGSSLDKNLLKASFIID